MSRRSQKRQQPIPSTSAGLTQDPSTLVYSNLFPDKLPFEDFSLIVRSLHKFMVEDIKEFRESNAMHVELGYQASVKNNYLKLGPSLASMISINKLSQFVKDNELPRLASLQQKYRFRMSDAAGEENTEIEDRPVLPAIQQPHSHPKRKRHQPMPDSSESDGESQHM